jgi:hypothetical protein
MQGMTVALSGVVGAWVVRRAAPRSMRLTTRRHGAAEPAYSSVRIRTAARSRLRRNGGGPAAQPPGDVTWSSDVCSGRGSRQPA